MDRSRPDRDAAEPLNPPSFDIDIDIDTLTV